MENIKKGNALFLFFFMTTPELCFFIWEINGIIEYSQSGAKDLQIHTVLN